MFTILMKNKNPSLKEEVMKNVNALALENVSEIQVAKSIQLKKDGDLALFKGFKKILKVC